MFRTGKSVLSVFPCALLVLLAALPAALPAKEAEKKKPKDPAADINAPQPGARKIAFTASQGTWTSVDVSPDGKTLVFDLLGDLYDLPLAGGKARRLTSGPAWDSQPRYSPDGATIAFTSDRNGIDNLWLMAADGKDLRALTADKDQYTRTADWTPDGEVLVARREDGKLAGIPPVELYLFSRHGGLGVKLTNSDEVHNASGPVASADGRFLYFSQRQRRFNYIPNLQDGLWQVARHDRQTGEVAQLTGGVGGAVRPAISPDGKKLVYVSRRDGATVLVLRDLVSGAERILAAGLGRDEMEGFASADLYPGYDFTPDGAALVISDRGRLARIEIADGKRSEIPFSAEVEQWAAPRVAWQDKDHFAEGPLRLKVLKSPTISPANDALVFEALGRLWRQPLVAGKPDGAPARITPESMDLPAREYTPALSPDGAWVAYVSWSDKNLGEVWKVPAAGGAPIKLTALAAHYAKPVWSADGSQLAILRGSGLELRGRQPEEEQAFELHLLPAAGGATRYVATVGFGAGQVYHPHVSFIENGQRLLFSAVVPGKKPTDEAKTDLVSVRLDGSDRKVHVRLPVTSEVLPSPDLRWVAFTSRDTVYLSAWPPLKTAEPVEIALADGPLPTIRLSDPAGNFLGWADGGKTLTWSLADTFHKLPVERALAFADEERRKAAEKEKEEAKSGDKKESDKKGGKEAKEEKAEEPDLKLPKSDSFRIALSATRSKPSGSFVLRGARVITMKGDEILPSADIVVTGNRIAAIGAAGSVAVPDGAASFDAAGTSIVPGLIDTHAHLHYSAFEIYPETKWEYLANLAYGVTTTYDPSAPTVDVFAQAEMVETGRMIGPRIYSSGMVLYGGQAQDIWAQVEDLEDARRQVKRMQAWGALMIKVYQQPRRSQRLWFAEAARQEKMLLTAEGGGDLFGDLTMAMDGYTAFEHSLPVELGDDAARFVAESGTHYTPTLLVSYGGPWGELYFWQNRNPHEDAKLNRFVPHFALDNWGRRHPWYPAEEWHFPLVAEGAAKVARAGGNVSLGAHGQLQGLGVHWELWAMAGDGGRGQGMTPHEALRAATERAAEKLGLLPDLGTVDKGKLADFLVLDGDPLADIHNTEKIRWVIKNGEVYEAATMKRLWPTVVEPPKQYWQQQDARGAGY
jgi:Tol biopolymer transport system component/imidazolonepropionase-like amidohydrolase